MELVDGSYQAVTQVKVLSPETIQHRESRQRSLAGRQNIAGR